MSRLLIGYYPLSIGNNCAMEVQAMALDAKVRFVLLQKVVSNRAVGCVADCAVFCDRGVFKDIGSTFVLMTLKAQLVFGFISSKERANFRTVRVMTI